jgi:XTP/dITP diphosphohydrolase
MTTLLIATRNAHKVGEIWDLLGACFGCLMLNDFPGAPQVVEDADTFAGNAIKKAVELAKWLREKPPTGNLQRALPNFVLADDSGLEVDVLKGAPGVHSARFAALDHATDGSLSAGETGNSPDAENNAKLLRLLRDVPEEKRSARFCCVIALVAMRADRGMNASPVCYSDELVAHTFVGACAGRIRWAPSGQGGFGYDPLFVPAGYAQSFSELGGEVKNMISHRAKALDQVKNFLRQVD